MKSSDVELDVVMKPELLHVAHSVARDHIESIFPATDDGAEGPQTKPSALLLLGSCALNSGEGTEIRTRALRCA